MIVSTYTSTEPVIENRDNDGYEVFLSTLQQYFSQQTTGATPLFTTDYVAGVPAETELSNLAASSVLNRIGCKLA